MASGQTAVLAIRLPSGALTFHLPVQTTARRPGGPSRLRFRVAVKRPAPRGVGEPDHQGHGHRGRANAGGCGDRTGAGPAGAGLRAVRLEAARSEGRLASGRAGHAQSRCAQAGTTHDIGSLAPAAAWAAVERRGLVPRSRTQRILQPHHACLRRSRVRIRALHDLSNAGRERPDAARRAARPADDLRCRRILARRSGAANAGRARECPRPDIRQVPSRSGRPRGGPQ